MKGIQQNCLKVDSNLYSKMLAGQLFSNEAVLKYEQTISLKSICAVNIVANLWINEKVRLEKCMYGSDRESDLEDIILTKMKQLHLPRAITGGQLVPITYRVETALRTWIIFHDKYLFDYDYETKRFDSNAVRRDDLSTKYLPFIKFTNNARIDQMKTAKRIVIEEPDQYLKYKLACHYCLEEEFQNIPLTIKNEFYPQCVQQYLDIDEYPMLFYWTCHIMNGNQDMYEILRNRNNDGKSLSEYILDEVIVKWKYDIEYFEVALKYLWNKLTNTEKSNERVVSVINGLENIDLKYLFISTLDYKQQQIIFKDISYSFLSSMLCDLMWRDRFVSTTCHLFDMLDLATYYKLLKYLCGQIDFHFMINDKFCNIQYYKETLKALWERTPYPFKEYIFNQYNGGGMIILTSDLEESFDLIQMLLADMPETDKKNAIYSDTGLDACICYIKEEKWALLDSFIKSLLLTIEDQIKFKKYLVLKSSLEVYLHYFDRECWDKINYFFKWAFQSEDEIADFKKSVRMTKCENWRGDEYYEIYSSHNAEDKYDRIFRSEESLKEFQKIFLMKI